MRQLGAILIIIFIGIGSTHITINQHLCNGELESTALFIEAQPCEHASANENLPPCHKKADQKKCCSTNQITIEAIDWFQFTNVEQEHIVYQVTSPSFGFNSIVLVLSEDLKEDFSLKKTKIPPLIKEDLFIWDESYLI